MGSQGITVGIATVRGLRVGAKMVVWIYSWSKQTRTRAAFGVWILVGKVSMSFGVPVMPCRMLASKSVLVGGIGTIGWENWRIWGLIVHVLLTAVRKRRWVRMVITYVITVDRGRGTRNPSR